VTALAANSETVAPQVFSRDVRQLGIWWSMDSLRTVLGQKLGVPLEPETPASWNEDEDLRANTILADRHEGWKNSLPLSLQNPQLVKAEEPYVHALEAKGAKGKIIGAIFVINGQVEGADIYRSHDLFVQMWPKLLRAYATEAIAFSGAKRAHLPKIRQLRQFLTAAEQAPARDFGAGNSIHEGDAAIYTSTVDKDGAWVYRSYVAKLPTDALLPEGVIVNILDNGKVGERALASIGDKEMVVLHRDHSDNSFAGTVEKNPNAAATVRAPVIRTARIVPLRVVDNAAFNDRWQASVMTKPQIEDARSSVQIPDRSSSSAGFELVVLTVGAFVFVTYLLLGFSLPPVGSWARSLARTTKRLWCEATAKLLQLVELARHVRRPVRPAPEILTPAVVRRLSQAVRRGSYADRATLLRSRRVGPPKDESQDLPLAA